MSGSNVKEVVTKQLKSGPKEKGWEKKQILNIGPDAKNICKNLMHGQLDLGNWWF